MNHRASPLAAIVGVGHTRFGDDWRRKDVVRLAADLAKEALDEALADSGLSAGDIDGVAVAAAPGGLIASPALNAQLGLAPRWSLPANVLQALDGALDALRSRKAQTIAIIYASSQRSVDLKYGGPQSGSQMYPSYYYYHPWGFSSQGAHWAMLFNRYKQLFNVTEEQLGAVAVLQRRNAALNPFAVMQKSLTIADYLAARYVCRPLRLLDYCPVNDGAVTLILTRAELAKTARRPGAIIAARAHAHAGASAAAQLRPLVMDMQQTLLGAASAECFAQAGMSRSDVDHFQCYDAFSINLPISLEGVGFCERGEGLRFVNDGRADIGAQLPCNTSGGLLSEAYMHGWNHLVEAVRQLRGEAGPRQVKDAEVSCYSFFDSESANVTLMRRA